MVKAALIALGLAIFMAGIAGATPPTYPNEYCSFTGSDSAATLTTGYFYFHLFGGKWEFEVAPDGCAILVNAMTQFSASPAVAGNALFNYDMVLTLPNGSSTATNVTNAATDAHEGIGDVAVGGTVGDSLIIGSSGFPPLYVQIQPGTLATPAAATLVRVQYLTSGGWVNVDSTGVNTGIPAQVNTLGVTTACGVAGYYCYDVAGANSWGVGNTGLYAYNGNVASNANTIQLFSSPSGQCSTTGSNCWIPAAFTKQNIQSVLGITGADTAPRWYVRFLVAGANFTTMPANMLAQVAEVANADMMFLKRYGGVPTTGLGNILSNNYGFGSTNALIKMQNDLMPSLIKAGVDGTAEGDTLEIPPLTGDGGITVNSNAIVPVEQNAVLSEWAAGRPGPSPAITPIKELNTNLTGYCAAAAQRMPDVYDPAAQTAYTNAAKFQFGISPYSAATPHDGTIMFGIETEEGDFTPWGDNPAHGYPIIPIVTNPMGAVGEFFTPAAGQYTIYSKTLGWRDFELNRYFCTAASTPLACCSGNQTGTCTADTGSTTLSAGQLSTALTSLNTAFGLTGGTACTGSASFVCNSAYTTWNTSDGGGLSGIANNTYASYGTGTGLLDENGKRLIVNGQCAANWFAVLASAATIFENWGSNTATNIFNDFQAFLTVYAAKYESEIFTGYNTALGSTTPTATRPPMLCTAGTPPEVITKGIAPYCDAILTFNGFAFYPGSTTNGNVTADPSIVQSNLQTWENDAYNSAGHSVPFMDLDFSNANSDHPMGLDLQGQTAGTNCQITSRSFSSPNTTIVAENCPSMTAFQRGLYSPDTTGAANCPFGVNSAGVMVPIQTIVSTDYQAAATTFVVSGDWTTGSPACLSVGNHLQMGALQAAPGFGGNAAKQVAVNDFNSWVLQATSHWTMMTNQLNVTDPGGHHDFVGRLYWDFVGDPQTGNSAATRWGFVDDMGNLLDGVEDTSAGGCSSIVGTCGNANCVDLAYKNSNVSCDPLGYPTGGEGPLLALYPGNAGNLGNRIGPPCTLGAQSGCGIDLNAISFLAGTVAGVGSGNGGRPGMW